MQNETTSRAEVTVRRSPRYGRFMIVGVVIFAIVAFVLAYGLPRQGNYNPSQVFGYLLLVGIVLGVTLGGLVALALDRSAARSARTVAADRLDARSTHDETAPDAASDSLAHTSDAGVTEKPDTNTGSSES